MKTISGIYKITNLKNGNTYIGCSRDIWGRWRIHYNALEMNRHENSKLQKEWNIYEQKSFEFSIIIQCDIDKLFNLEEFFIKHSKNQIGSCNLLNIAMVDPPRGGCRLSDDQVREIRKRFHNGESMISITKDFNVNYDTVCNAAKGKTYKHVV
jgi:group I intron endonuclease